MRVKTQRQNAASVPVSAAVMGRYWRARDAELVLEAWRRSGESVAAFARQQGVDPRRLLRWRSRLKSARAPLFHPVRVVTSAEPEVSRAASLELEVRGGRRIHVPRGFDPELLEELVRAVESLRC